MEVEKLEHGSQGPTSNDTIQQPDSNSFDDDGRSRRTGNQIYFQFHIMSLEELLFSNNSFFPSSNRECLDFNFPHDKCFYWSRAANFALGFCSAWLVYWSCFTHWVLCAHLSLLSTSSLLLPHWWPTHWSKKLHLHGSCHIPPWYQCYFCNSKEQVLHALTEEKHYWVLQVEWRPSSVHGFSTWTFLLGQLGTP